MEIKPIDACAVVGKVLVGTIKAIAKSSKPLPIENHIEFVPDLKTGKVEIKVVDPSGKLIRTIPFDRVSDLSKSSDGLIVDKML